MMTDCSFCKKETDCKLCAQCKTRSYCSVECQKADWKAGHKKQCKKPRQRPAADQSLADAAKARREMKKIEELGENLHSFVERGQINAVEECREFAVFAIEIMLRRGDSSQQGRLRRVVGGVDDTDQLKRVPLPQLIDKLAAASNLLLELMDGQFGDANWWIFLAEIYCRVAANPVDRRVSVLNVRFFSLLKFIETTPSFHYFLDEGARDVLIQLHELVPCFHLASHRCIHAIVNATDDDSDDDSDDDTSLPLEPIHVVSSAVYQSVLETEKLISLCSKADFKRAERMFRQCQIDEPILKLITQVVYFVEEYNDSVKISIEMQRQMLRKKSEPLLQELRSAFDGDDVDPSLLHVLVDESFHFMVHIDRGQSCDLCLHWIGRCEELEKKYGGDGMDGVDVLRQVRDDLFAKYAELCDLAGRWSDSLPVYKRLLKECTPLTGRQETVVRWTTCEAQARFELDQTPSAGQELLQMMDEQLTIVRQEMGEFSPHTVRYTAKRLTVQARILLLGHEIGTPAPGKLKLKVASVIEKIRVQADLFTQVCGWFGSETIELAYLLISLHEQVGNINAALEFAFLYFEGGDEEKPCPDLLLVYKPFLACGQIIVQYGDQLDAERGPHFIHTDLPAHEKWMSLLLTWLPMLTKRLDIMPLAGEADKIESLCKVAVALLQHREPSKHRDLNPTPGAVIPAMEAHQKVFKKQLSEFRKKYVIPAIEARQKVFKKQLI